MLIAKSPQARRQLPVRQTASLNPRAKAKKREGSGGQGTQQSQRRKPRPKTTKMRRRRTKMRTRKAAMKVRRTAITIRRAPRGTRTTSRRPRAIRLLKIPLLTEARQTAESSCLSASRPFTLSMRSRILPRTTRPMPTWISTAMSAECIMVLSGNTSEVPSQRQLRDPAAHPVPEYGFNVSSGPVYSRHASNASHVGPSGLIFLSQPYYPDGVPSPYVPTGLYPPSSTPVQEPRDSAGPHLPNHVCAAASSQIMATACTRPICLTNPEVLTSSWSHVGEYLPPVNPRLPRRWPERLRRCPFLRRLPPPIIPGSRAWVFLD